MYISFEWLTDFLDLSNISAEQLADMMSRSGIEVENVINIGSNLSNIVIGEVVEASAHPDSDHLAVTQVNIGQDQLQQIVCGAPNVAQGQKVIVALPGAKLSEDFEIQETVLRGVASNGMICSLQELGLSDSVIPKEYAKGIFILPEDAPVGEDAIKYLQLDDSILELDVTPNRADALSIRGIAYEVGAIINQQPKFDLLSLDNQIKSDLIQTVTVDVAEKSLSPHYQLHLIENVQVEESPIWIQMRLMKANIRPINNVVDMTNYFLLLYGQPMHAFDYDALPSKNIQIKPAQEGQLFTTLDDEERKLSGADVMICSGGEPVALAGVMGGLDSEVTNTTKNVLLETAVFNPQRVRSTSKKFNLRSESSLRFEKGINNATIDESGDQAAEFIARLTNGKAANTVVEFKDIAVESAVVKVANNAISNKIGIELSNDDITEIIERLGFSVKFEADYFLVEVPPRRWDISIEADMLEEIARIYGYDKIPATLPAAQSHSAGLTLKQKLIRQTRQIAEGLGLNQVISYVLTSDKNADLLKSADYSLVSLALPMSEDRTVLRQSLFPALIEIAQYNRARQNKGLAFYEEGRVFFGQGENNLPIEAERFAILLSGEQEASTWYAGKKNYDFYSLKGILESYFDMIRLSDYVTYTQTTDISVMHPGRTAEVRLNDKVIGFFGQIHPNIADQYDLDKATFFAEMDFDAITRFTREALIQSPIPKYPATSRDIAVLVSNQQTNQELVELILNNGTDKLISVELFDRYVGDNIAEDKQSLAYHLVFQDPNKTLTDQDVDQIMTGIQTALLNIKDLEIR